MKTKLFLLFLFIRSFANAQGVNVSTVTGSSQGDAIGSSSVARFWGPYGIASNANIAITDTNNHKIKYIYSDNSTVLLAGSTLGFVNGTGAAARFNNPTGIARLMFNDFVVCDTGNNAIRRVTTSFPLGVTTTIAGNSGTAGYVDGPASSAKFNQPFGIAVNTANDDIYISDTFNHVIRKISGTTVSTFAGSTQGYTDGAASAAQFDTPLGLVLDSNGNVFVIDKARIRKITPAGVVTTFAGSSTAGYLDGTGTAAQFANGMSGITIDPNNNLYVTDTGNLRVRKITPAGVVTTFAGSGVYGADDGEASVATFSYFGGISYHIGSGPFALNVADNNNNRVRKITVVPATVPTITNISAINSSTSATINYSLNANFGATTSVVKYGLSSTNLSSQVTGFSASGNSLTTSSAQISGLVINTLYYYQIEATNSAGTTTSSIGTFSTSPDPTFQVIAEYNFNNTYNNVLGTNAFTSNIGTSFTLDRNGNTNSAININNTGATATILNLPYGSASRTISFWAKLNTIQTPYNMTFSYGSPGSGSACGGGFNSSSVDFYGYANNLNAVSTNSQGVWYFFTYTYDGTNAKIYKNGTLLNTVAKSWNTLNNSNIFKLGIGVGGEFLFNGAIDDFKIFNNALNDNQILQLYNNNLTLSSQNFNQKDLQVSIYPNPASDILNIQMEKELKLATIYTILGNQVLSSTDKQINVSSLSSGNYFVRVEAVDGAVSTQKIIIK